MNSIHFIDVYTFFFKDTSLTSVSDCLNPQPPVLLTPQPPVLLIPQPPVRSIGTEMSLVTNLCDFVRKKEAQTCTLRNGVIAIDLFISQLCLMRT